MKNIKEILAALIGNENTLSTNVLFIKYTGSHAKAVFLGQLFYWSSKMQKKGGWFAKSYDDWMNEVYIEERTLRRYANEFKDAGLLETTVKKFGGVPTLHYRLDIDQLIAKLGEFVGADNLSGGHGVRVDADNLSGSKEADNVSGSIYKEDYKQRVCASIDADPVKKKKKSARFTPPSLGEIKEYFQKKLREKKVLGADAIAESEADKFFNHYQSNGWMVGRTKMKSWTHSAAGWLSRMNQYNLHRSHAVVTQPAAIDDQSAERLRKVREEIARREATAAAHG